jgi:hypothetical protein
MGNVFTVGLLAATLTLTMQANTLLANAEKELADLNDPLLVQVTTPVNATDTEEHTQFSAVLTESITHNDYTLPAGTIFNGEIEKVTESHMFARPGYVKFNITEVAYPNGTSININNQHKSQKLYHEDANTVKKAASTAWPFAAVNAAITFPMRILGIPGGFPIALAAKMGLGVTQEINKKKHEEDNRKTQQKVGRGMLLGTGLPGAVFIISKRPEPEINPGDDIQLFLDPENMSLVFAGTDEDNIAVKKVSGELSPVPVSETSADTATDKD